MHLPICVAHRHTLITNSIKLQRQMHACEWVFSFLIWNFRLIVWDRWPLNWPLKEFLFVIVLYMLHVWLFFSFLRFALRVVVFCHFHTKVPACIRRAACKCSYPSKMEQSIPRCFAPFRLPTTAHAIPQITCGVNGAKVPFVMHR